MSSTFCVGGGKSTVRDKNSVCLGKLQWEVENRYVCVSVGVSNTPKILYINIFCCAVCNTFCPHAYECIVSACNSMLKTEFLYEGK